MIETNYEFFFVLVIIFQLYYIIYIFYFYFIYNLKYDNWPFVYSVRELRIGYKESIVLKSRSSMTSNILDTDTKIKTVN